MNFFYRLFRKKDDKAHFILVLLLRAPYLLDRSTLESAARTAWLDKFGANEDGSDFVCSGTSDSGFVLSPHGNAFLLLPTLRGVRKLGVPQNLADPGCSDAWAAYAADVSVGLVYSCETDRNRLRVYMATLTAELIDQNCLALVHPESGRIFAAHPGLSQELRERPAQFMG